MASPMSVQVLEAEDADMDRVFEIASLAFQRNEPFFDFFWPKHWLVTGRTAGAERMRKTKNEDPYTTYLKALNDEGKIMGMAKWNVYDKSIPPELDNPSPLGDHWETEDEKEFAGTLGADFIQCRHGAIRLSKGNLVSLDILAIDPAYQRRGVGDALVKWGTAKADKMGVETVVESSVFGKGLYEKNGFVFQGDVELHVPEKFRPKPASRFAWLTRPKREADGKAM